MKRIKIKWRKTGDEEHFGYFEIRKTVLISVEILLKRRTIEERRIGSDKIKFIHMWDYRSRVYFMVVPRANAEYVANGSEFSFNDAKRRSREAAEAHIEQAKNDYPLVFGVQDTGGDRSDSSKTNR